MLLLPRYSGSYKYKPQHCGYNQLGTYSVQIRHLDTIYHVGSDHVGLDLPAPVWDMLEFTSDDHDGYGYAVLVMR